MHLFRLHVVVSTEAATFRVYPSKVRFKDALRGHLLDQPPLEARALLERLDEVWRDQLPYLCLWHVYGDQVRYGLTECGDLRKAERVVELVTDLTARSSVPPK